MSDRILASSRHCTNIGVLFALFSFVDFWINSALEHCIAMRHIIAGFWNPLIFFWVYKFALQSLVLVSYWFVVQRRAGFVFGWVFIRSAGSRFSLWFVKGLLFFNEYWIGLWRFNFNLVIEFNERNTGRPCIADGCVYRRGARAFRWSQALRVIPRGKQGWRFTARTKWLVEPF